MSTPTKLGNVCGVIGLQWGDEGKGKIIDILSSQFDIIARAAGGANAGHTIVVNGKKHVFRLLPSGALHPNVSIVLGGGMVIHLPTLLEEIDLLKAVGISIVERLFIANNAHVLFEFHKAIDGIMEDRKAKKGSAIGTTRRGIGPAYGDKVARTGIRMEDIKDTVKLRKILCERSSDIEQMYGVKIDVDTEIAMVEKSLSLLCPCIRDTVTFLHSSLTAKRRMLLEGAQGALLDLDHGTYPFVTSSATTMTAALHYLGLAPQSLTSCIGVMKAYCTRVGSGPFPMEAQEDRANILRKRGGEFGSVTGRPRRCGWLSLPDIERSIAMNGVTHINLTKLDVLDGEPSIPLCIAMKEGKPVTKEIPGWSQSTANCTNIDALPKEAQEFISTIEDQIHCPLAYIGTGPERAHMIER